jgi:hypothetical protein
MNKKILLALIAVFTLGMYLTPLFVIPISLCVIGLILDMIPLRTNTLERIDKIENQYAELTRKIASINVTLQNRTRP